MDRITIAINNVDWNAFEKSILALAAEGAASYEALTKANGDRVFQVSIWTDTAAAVSAISFETLDHTISMMHTGVAWLKERDYHDEAADWLKQGRAHNPADFLYKNAAECEHPELAVTAALVTTDRRRKIADTFISEHLVRIREKILQEGLLRELPREDTVWFAVSSTNDWYDHEIAVSL